MATVTSEVRELTGKPSHGLRVWQVLILLIGTLVLADNVHHAWNEWNFYPGAGPRGFYVIAFGPDGFERIGGVAPGSDAAALGMREGDEVRCDHGMDCERVLRIGEKIGVTLRRDGALSHHEILIRRLRAAPGAPVAKPGPGPSAAPGDTAAALTFLFTYGVKSLTCLIGMFVALRARRQLSSIIFAAALVSLGQATTFATVAESDPRLFPAYICYAQAAFYANAPLLLAFALAARRETSGKVSRAWRVVLLTYVAAVAACAVYIGNWQITARAMSSVVQGFALQGAVRAFGYVASFVVLAMVWREIRGQNRTRYAYMLAASILLTLSSTIQNSLVFLAGNEWSLGNPLILLTIFSAALGAGVFAYAVVRHRVIDLGFAVNRTLIYAVVSAVLLAAFGLIEWAVDHFVPIEGREKNALVDAAVAVAVFLTFHRVRDGVEHLIEGLFFRRWQRAEADLRRFVKEAAFVVQSSALTPAFARALSDYAEGAEAAVYMADGRRYRLAAGGIAAAPADLDADLPALVSVRAEPRPIEVRDGALAGCLVAPMVNRNEVIGVALVGLKPSGHAYRPDEIELIGWATRQVGLDLHTLKMEQLEAENAQIATLRTEIATLRSIIPQRA